MWSASVCLMCLKTFDSEKDLNLKLSACQFTSSKSFLLFCERFLKLPESLISKFWGNGNEFTGNHFCSECGEILRGTFQLYQELCEIQLKLAWRLRQWESLLENGSSQRTLCSSKKLNSLLHQKLSEQLQLDVDTKDRARGKKEVRNLRNLLLKHCRNARNEMVSREMEISLDRCSLPVPFPKRENFLEAGTMTTSFLVLDSTSDNNVDNDFTRGQTVGDLGKPKVKVEVDEDDFEGNLSKNEYSDQDEAMDWEMETNYVHDDDYGDIKAAIHNQVQEPSTSTSKLRRSTKAMSYFPKKPAPNPNKKSKPKVNVKVTKTSAQPQPDWIPCEVCGVPKPSSKHLFNHYHHRHESQWRKKNSGKIAPFQCYFCWKSLCTEQSRMLHIEHNVHNSSMTTKKFSCYEEFCRGSPPFPTFNDLEAHFESVHSHSPGNGQEVFKCSLCSWPFSNDGLRQTHELLHVRYWAGEKMKCPSAKCGHAEHANFSGLQTHFILEHTDLKDPKIHGCHKCSARYNDTVSLINHLKTHEMEEDLATGSSKTYHICEHCGKRCATQRILTSHVWRLHQNEKCDTCGEIVKNRTRLQQHMRRVHKIDLRKDHACPICQKQFVSNDLMKRHVRTVHQKGNDTTVSEVCHICSKEYQRRGLLHRHLRVAHQIEAEGLKRPAKFVCPECGMGYYYKSSLDQHVDAKHRSSEERKHQFPCTMCSKTFWRKCTLVKHLEEAHSESRDGHGHAAEDD